MAEYFQELIPSLPENVQRHAQYIVIHFQKSKKEHSIPHFKKKFQSPESLTLATNRRAPKGTKRVTRLWVANVGDTTWRAVICRMKATGFWNN